MERTAVMIHGMFSRPWVWEEYRSRFEERGWTCLTPVLRHHDVAPDDPPPEGLGTTSILDYAGDLETLIRGLDSPPVLVGHSMGGLLVQMLAARNLARAAVLLCPAAPAGVIGLSPAVIRSFFGILTTWGFWRKAVRPSYRAARYAFLQGFPSEAERRAQFNRLVHESGRAVFEIGLWPLDRRHAARVDPRAVSCPLLVVGAGRDHATPSFVARAVARRYPGAALLEVPEMAHWVLSEPGWDQVAEAVLHWLEALPG